ncbi:MAG TPA: hypothetical protein VKY35_02105, partial [Aliidiomarina sp.]|nr:hypothetical protein [Aliidiomarina sp.]
SAVGAILGKIPTREEYMEYAQSLDAMSGEIYKYLNFDEMPDFQAAEKKAKELIIPTINVA